MYCDPPRSQIIDPQHTANHISSKIVKDQDFPYWIPLGIKDWSCFGNEAIRSRKVMLGYGWFGRGMVEVQDFFERSCSQI